MSIWCIKNEENHGIFIALKVAPLPDLATKMSADDLAQKNAFSFFCSLQFFQCEYSAIH